jgi:hypothetical protein
LKKQADTDFSGAEVERRFETALRGAFKTPAAQKNVTPKEKKGKPAKASPSSDASRASAKTGKP